MKDWHDTRKISVCFNLLFSWVTNNIFWVQKSWPMLLISLHCKMLVNYSTGGLAKKKSLMIAGYISKYQLAYTSQISAIILSIFYRYTIYSHPNLSHEVSKWVTSKHVNCCHHYFLYHVFVGTVSVVKNSIKSLSKLEHTHKRIAFGTLSHS